jgi:CheY-like chemotaxis protein/anti-sigma regulatory factor (Ser/Thr protein kinase)
VHADSTRLKQVLLNLLSNAIKYNRDRGRVDVSVEREGNTIRLGVRDTGRGMSEAQLAQIFQPFSRLGLEDGEIEGTGIGLSITRRLVELMEGRIDVATEVDVGTEFRVWLTIDDGMPKEAAPALLPAAVPDAQSLTATVLYVEDNALNRLVMREVLALRPGIRLLEAASGAAALALAVAEHPDLVMIDLHLPDMDGFELLRRLRARLEDSVACMMLSASAQPGDSERAVQSGFLAYWSKPIVATTFLQSLDRTLAQLQSKARA